jgi:serine/threonine-protein kinase
MATVFRAFDTGFNREVALKVLPREMMHNLNFRARFKRELKTIASLEHPAIVPVYDVGEESGQPFFVMRYMAGGSLSQLIEKGRFTLQDTARIIERVALALDHAHRQGIIHRDIKPDNILFDLANNPYVSDFGVAKLNEAAYSATQEGRMVGTPGYMSPEQAYNRPVDARSDVYGLGAIVYQMLSGKPPYQLEPDAPIASIVKHINEPIPDILKENPDLPPAVDAIIKTSMAKDRENRYATTIELARALNLAAFGEDRILHPSTTIVDRPTVPTRSRSRWWLIGGVILLLLIGMFALRGQLSFLSPASTPTSSRTPSPTDIPPTGTPSPLPTSTPVIEPTSTQDLTTVLPATGGADQIAFLSANQIHLMNVDGSALVQVRTDNASKQNLQWIADGNLVYMSRNCAYFLNASTKETSQIVCFNLNEQLEGFRVSPDGRLVAISVQRTLNIVPFDLEALKRVNTRFNLLTMKQSCFYSQYAFRDVIWSKDGKKFAALVVDTELSSTDQIFLVDVDIQNCQTTGPVLLDKLPGNHFEVGSARIPSYDWNGDHLFLLNDYVRNDGFGDLYLYNSETQEGVKINPIDGNCCYRDARFSPDGKYILFLYQNRFGTEIKLHYVPFSELENGQPLTPIELPGLLLRFQREKPQPALRTAQ